MTARYRVQEITAVIVKGYDVGDWETVPAFQVQRVETDMAWAVAKYQDKGVAEKVALLLAAHAAQEAE